MNEALVPNLPSPAFLGLLLLLTVLIFILINHFTSPSSRRARPLPPGPRPWPIIGNIHQLGKNPHVSTAQMAKSYGPLISLRLGNQLCVVGSSPEAATQILKIHDRSLSGRCSPKASPFPEEVMDKFSLVWVSKCSDHWKSLRALCRTELFSPKAVESQAALREKKVSEMVQFIKDKEGQVVSIGELVFNTVFNVLSNLFFSNDLLGLGDTGDHFGPKSIVEKMMELGVTPNIADFYPFLAPMDLQGLRRQVKECSEKLYQIWEEYIKKRRDKKHINPDAPKSDFLDIFLANGFSDQQINMLVMELFIAGTDTSTTTIEWAMAELINNKEVMNKVKEELKREASTYPLTESQLSQLPYLNACVKETLRLHPPVPLILHRAVENSQVMGYTIPKNSRVLVNIWAIARDPSTWEDPLMFKPERFLGSNLDFRGHDYEFIPFGSGRRICPGLPLATKQVNLILATLVHCFEWSLPNGGQLEKVDMRERFGITLQKDQPLLLVPKIKKM